MKRYSCTRASEWSSLIRPLECKPRVHFHRHGGVRSISRNSAIATGLRTERQLDRDVKRQRLSSRPLGDAHKKQWPVVRNTEEPRTESTSPGLVRRGAPALDLPKGGYASRSVNLDRASGAVPGAGASQVPLRRPRSDDEDAHPVSVPYQSAASVLIPGLRQITAALRAKRRKLYKLYIAAGTQQKPDRPQLLDLAATAKIPIVPIEPRWFDRVMAQLAGSEGPTVHDGVLLDASPLPKLPIEALSFFSKTGEFYNVELAKQSKEEAQINGTNTRLKYSSGGWRYPFLIWLHQVVDTQNIGAIARTAFYFGADGLILTRRATGDFTSSGAQKASAGASEFLPTMVVEDPHDFISRSQANGWGIYAAVTPEAHDEFAATLPALKKIRHPFSSYLATIYPPLLDKPAILMLGNEDLGLSASVIKEVSHKVVIPTDSKLAQDAGLDSLNVATAAAILMERFLARPSKGAAEKKLNENMSVQYSGKMPRSVAAKKSDSLRPEYIGAALPEEIAEDDSEEAEDAAESTIEEDSERSAGETNDIEVNDSGAIRDITSAASYESAWADDESSAKVDTSAEPDDSSTTSSVDENLPGEQTQLDDSATTSADHEEPFATTQDASEVVDSGESATRPVSEHTVDVAQTKSNDNTNETTPITVDSGDAEKPPPPDEASNEVVEDASIGAEESTKETPKT